MNAKLAKRLRHFASVAYRTTGPRGLVEGSRHQNGWLLPKDWVDTAAKLLRIMDTPWYAEALAEIRPHYNITLINRPGSVRSHYRALKGRVKAVKAGLPPRCAL